MNDNEPGGVVRGLNKLPLFNQIGIMVELAVSVAIGVAIAQWSDKPIYRPLINDMTVLDASKAVDILEQNNIVYSVDVKHHILYVDILSADVARLKLAKAGFDMEYPNIDYDIEKASEEKLLKTCNAIKSSDFMSVEHKILVYYLKPLLAIIVVLAILFGTLRPAMKGLVKMGKE